VLRRINQDVALALRSGRKRVALRGGDLPALAAPMWANQLVLTGLRRGRTRLERLGHRSSQPDTSPTYHTIEARALLRGAPTRWVVSATRALAGTSQTPVRR